MRVLGLIFAGTSTERRAEMQRFCRDVLGMALTSVDGVEADMFTLPDGSQFAVASRGGMGETDRSVGFLVADLHDAMDAVSQAGLEVGPVSENAVARYAHFRAPDGYLYELVQHTESQS